MADSTTHLDVLVTGQFQDEVTMNQLFDAISPAMAWARRESKSYGLVTCDYGGRMGTSSATIGVPFGLDDDSTYYFTVRIEDGQISYDTDTVKWNNTDEYRRLYKLTTAAGEMTWEDHRQLGGGNG